VMRPSCQVLRTERSSASDLCYLVGMII
jgi:hypothetical protein